MGSEPRFRDGRRHRRIRSRVCAGQTPRPIRAWRKARDSEPPRFRRAPGRRRRHFRCRLGSGGSVPWSRPCNFSARFLASLDLRGLDVGGRGPVRRTSVRQVRFRFALAQGRRVMPDLVTSLLSIGSGGIVGLVLGLVGGGGSILAVPLLVYVVAVRSPHVAIGTSAVAVAASALGNLLPHWRNGNVKWACAAVFATAGVMGAFGGAAAAKAM